ncbi:glycosyl hydrolase family 28-related protein [Rhizobium sp. IMFF44]|uniref:glycosyl hydrolase family 28-related protein n=1 Tax=Rhizobium sp. IMFF44 TaxID=3342350 RepID=UPI0035B6E8FA
MSNYIDVTSFGVIPDGLSCCADDIERIVSHLPTNGATIYFPPGDYALTRSITIERSGVSLLGAGRNTSRFISERPDHSYFIFGTSSNQVTNFSVRELGFNSRTTREEGAYLHLNNVFNSKIADCSFANSHIAVNVENTSFFYMTDCMIIDPSPGTGLGVLVHGNGRHNDQYFSRVFVQSQDRSAPCAAGFRLANSQALWMTRCGAYHCEIGVHIIATSGRTCEHLFFSENHSDNCVSDGWLIEAGEAATVRRIQFMGDWAASNGGRGWTARSSGGTVDDISLQAVRVYNNGGAGVFAENVGMLSLQNSTLGGNSNNSEIELVGQNDTFICQGNRMGKISGLSSSASYMLAGIGSTRNTMVSGNICAGFDTLCDNINYERELSGKNIKISEV